MSKRHPLYSYPQSGNGHRWACPVQREELEDVIGQSDASDDIAASPMCDSSEQDRESTSFSRASGWC